jgi:hypothetical protein
MITSARVPSRTNRWRSVADRLPLGLGVTLLTWVLMLPIGIVGAAQIVGTVLRQLTGPAEMVDFVAFYTGGRLLLDAPSRLYDPTAWVELQTVLHGGPLPLLQFWNPPHTALLLVPLAILPFGVAYLVSIVLNLACLGGACYLLAPRATRAWDWLRWTLLLPLFLPVQVGLIMGQLSFALLLCFALFVRLADRAGPFWSALPLLAWATKPQLLPVLLLSLLFRRRWGTLVLVCALPVLLSVPVVLVGGWSVVSDYIQLGREAGSGVLTLEGTHLDPGHSVLGLAHRLLGPGWAANGLAVLGTLGVCLLVGSMWRAGLHTDARRYVQWAVLPLAAVLTAPHAPAYDAVLWLASAWLLLTLVGEVPRARRVVLVLLLVGWWGGNLAAFPMVNDIAPWGALSALVCLAGMAWLYRQPLVTPSASRRPTPP